MRLMRFITILSLLAAIAIATLPRAANAAVASLTYEITVIRDWDGNIIDRYLQETLHVVLSDPNSSWTTAKFRCDGGGGTNEHYWDSASPLSDGGGSWHYADPLVFRNLTAG